MSRALTGPHDSRRSFDQHFQHACPRPDRDRGAADPSDGRDQAAYKTTEFVVYVAAVLGVLIASNVVGSDENQHDYFPADRAWLYVTLLTIGYMISRGLAKAGSRSVDDA